jgi:hypothetical protein
MRRLQLGSQLIGMQISCHVGCSLPAPPGAINAAGSYPHCQPNSRNYETNDVSAAEEPVAFSASVLFPLQCFNTTIPVNIGT